VQRRRLVGLVLVLGCAAALSCKRAPVVEGGWLDTGMEVIPATQKPAFTLTGTDGQPFDFRRDTDGHLTLLFFGYTHCPDICPTHMSTIASAIKTLSAEDRARIRVVFVSTDPERDSTARIRSWLDNFDRDFIGLRGPLDDVNRIQGSIGLPPAMKHHMGASYEMGHAGLVMAFTADDSLRAMYPSGVTKEGWIGDLKTMLSIQPR
jgi:protein SCO1/2